MTTTPHLTAEQIAELRRLEQAATPGPWRLFTPDRGYQDDYVVTDDPEFSPTQGHPFTNMISTTESKDRIGSGNAVFIAALRNAAPALLEIAERTAACDTEPKGCPVPGACMATAQYSALRTLATDYGVSEGEDAVEGLRAVLAEMKIGLKRISEQGLAGVSRQWARALLDKLDGRKR